jgi:hypothetical protein
MLGFSRTVDMGVIFGLVEDVLLDQLVYILSLFFFIINFPSNHLDFRDIL